MRNSYVDIIKGIGIFLVILAHHKTILNEYIYSFHMPLFFLLSGIFHKNYSSYKEFFIKKVKILIIPYLTFMSSLFLFWFFISRRFGESSRIEVSVQEHFLGILTGAGISGISRIDYGAALWFLPCLFLVSNLYYFLSKFSKRNLIMINIVLAFIGVYLLNLNLKLLLVWHILTVFFSIQFYTTGALFKEKILNIKKENWIKIGFVFLLSLTFSSLNGKIDMNNNQYNNYLLFYISSFLGIYFILLVVKKINLKNKILEFLGKNSLIILGYHLRVTIVVVVIYTYFLKKEIPKEQLLFDLVYSVIQIILCLPIIYIFNKYFPFLIGKSKRD